ncbi:MAG TPA: hypothetical protein QF499_10450 [Gammaproteobacteria bacterium]|nr:hypothetical protein [Gammaproteobacteria bacterium]HJP39527.1 hypothetical protein [Gammaproteobacteria bacterium]
MLNSIHQNRLLIICILLFIVLGVIFFPSAGRDDDHIAFWSVNTILEFGDILSYSGERLEQGSSLGFIALMTIASAITRLPVQDIAVPLAVISGIMLLILLNKFKLFIKKRAVNYALLITATSFPFIYWSFSGLETSFYSLSLTFFCLFILKITTNKSGIFEYLYLFPVILTLQLLRPEAFFVIGLTICLFWLLKMAREIHQRNRNSSLIKTATQSEFTIFSAYVLLINCAAFAPLLIFRYTYFGNIFPQPVLSKISGIFPGLHSGIPIVPGSRYIIEFLIQNLIFTGSVIALLSIVFGILKRRNENRLIPSDILISLILSQLVFILLSGPDWMEAFRFIMPIIPIMSLMAGIFLYELCNKRPHINKPLVPILLCIQFAGLGYFVTNDSSSIPLWATRNNVTQKIAGANNYSWFSRANTHHLRDIPVVEALNNTIRELESVVGDRPIIITSYQAGFVMYHVTKEHFGRIRFIDLVGLADSTITKCLPLNNETRRLRDAAARKQQLGHLEVLRYLIRESDKAGTCFSPRPDIIYLMGEIDKSAPELRELGYEFAFNNTGNIALDFGKSEFYGGYLVDSKLFTNAGLKFAKSHISVDYQIFQ